MGLAAFNRARERQAAKAAQQAAEVSGVEEAAQESGEETAPLPALALINTAGGAADIEKLPEIGAKRAQKIFEARPDAGYLSFEQIQQLTKLEGVNWAAIAAWEG